MAIIYWWLIPLWLMAIGGFVVFCIRRGNKKTSKTDAKPIAHSARITQLTSYRVLFERQEKMIVMCIVGAVVIVLLAILLTSRPVAQSLVSPEQKNRDVMLCLDVSSSMFSTDTQVLKTFAKLVDGFGGQRIGLTNFNSSAVTIFPLTDDYELIKTNLTKGQAGFVALEKNGNVFSGMTDQDIKNLSLMTDGTTANFDAGSSLTGDGLAGCISRMGKNEQQRSQSVIFASDNEANGTQIVTTSQAAAYAKSKNIRVYAIDPGPTIDGGYTDYAVHTELQQAAVATGGKYFLSKDIQVQEIISDISKQEATLYTAPPELVRTDIPLPFIIAMTVVTLGLCVLFWRFRL